MKDHKFFFDVKSPGGLESFQISHNEDGWTFEMHSTELVLSVAHPNDDLYWEALRRAGTFLKDLQLKYRREFRSEFIRSETANEDGTSVVRRPVSSAPLSTVYESLGPAPAYKQWSRNPVALQAREYYFDAERKPKETLMYLYKAIERLKNECGGWKQLATHLGVPEGYIHYIKQRANQAKYDQRHPPKAGTALTLPHSEVEECKQRTYRLLELYAAKHPT